MSVYVTFEEWTQGRSIASFGSNTGASELPFQGWRRFKEAFAPELVSRAVKETPISVASCLDPFAGSGTTALACQLLGIRPTLIEVNPYLVDLIEAKLAVYDADALARDLGAVVKWARVDKMQTNAVFSRVPKTFVEPGVGGRWIFDSAVADRTASLLTSIDELTSGIHRRLFRVILGGILVSVSNVVVSGKGRRYRGGWQRRPRHPDAVDTAFKRAVQSAIQDIHRYARRKCLEYEMYLGVARTSLSQVGAHELAVFSPPYPNSFDYTDVYNIELWTLGYLVDRQSNRDLRLSTLCSHVQVDRRFEPPPTGSPILNRVLAQLDSIRGKLWDRRLPDMVGNYFSDMTAVLRDVHRALASGGKAWIVVGDSRYGDIPIKVADVLIELAPQTGWEVAAVEPCRSMRASAQQGGRAELAETLLVLSKP